MSLISADTIYVLCPANQISGGPELLHQLVHHLNILGHKAKIYYIPKNHPDPIPSDFEKYNIQYTFEIEDNSKNLLIVPEMYTGHLDRYKNIQKSIWWLSIDFYYESLTFRCPRCSLYQKILLYGNYLIKRRKFFYFNNHSKGIFHFVQSEYARQHLLEKGIDSNKISMLSDYLNDDFIEQQSIPSAKKDIVVYNPKKGFSFTQKLIKLAPSLEFLPIENMTRTEVSELLKAAKVYIDFGNHPGKDRLPREAAISGCCILTSFQGSANYHEDVPIENEYKFIDNEDNIENIIIKIKKCFDEYEEESKNFEEYRTIIKNQKNIFIQEITKVFVVNKDGKK